MEFWEKRQKDIWDEAERILDTEDQKALLETVRNIDQEDLLYVLIQSYNWDDGLDVPKSVVNNKNCHISTALTTFYLADGLSYLWDKSCASKGTFPEWEKFICRLYSRIINGEFSQGAIGFSPPLNKTHLFKLKKHLAPQEYIFIENIAGIEF